MLSVKRIFLMLVFIVVATGVWHRLKPLPKGISYEGDAVSTDDVRFYTDLTYRKDGKTVQEQEIFQQAFRMIDDAEKFVVLDLFLLNDDYDRKNRMTALSAELTRHLEEARKRSVRVVLITDPINTFYGAYSNKYLERLRHAGAEVVITDLSKLRDSNPIYSSFYRIFAQPFGVASGGSQPNPFSPDSPKVSVRAMLKMVNFKANHRKLIITEAGVLAASANPHDASSNHSNIALAVSDPMLVRHALAAEQAVLDFSGSGTQIASWGDSFSASGNAGRYSVQLLTEERICDKMRSAVQSAGAGDRIDIGVFYLSYRRMLDDLVSASQRGASVRVVLDPNKDAFGRQKNGIPNRQVAQELVSRSGHAVQVRWYLTQGEQFHAKYLKVTRGKEMTLFGGSCNFTRRNFENLNLESDISVTGPSDSDFSRDSDLWFERIWGNRDGTFTGPLSDYADDSLWKGGLYRLMEATGVCTF